MKLLLQPRNLFSCHVEVHKAVCKVDLGVLNWSKGHSLAPFGKLKGAHALLVVAMMWSNGCHEHNFGGLTQAVLKHSCELAGSVGYELALVLGEQSELGGVSLLSQALDHVTKGAQTCIDVLCLF